MKICVFVALFVVACNPVFGQELSKFDTIVPNDSVHVSADNIIDGVYIDFPLCDMDTTITFHLNSGLEWADSMRTYLSSYSFTTGTDSYCEIIINTKNCRCKDCSFTKIVLIRLYNLETSNIFQFDDSNSFWIVRNAWRYDPFEEGYTGTLDLTNHKLILNPTLKHQPEVILESQIVHHELLRNPINN